MPSNSAIVEHFGWNIQQARRQVPGELYGVMNRLESERAAGKGQLMGEELFRAERLR
jgi:hypothetical protein